jgi:hypothetical protein
VPALVLLVKRSKMEKAWSAAARQASSLARKLAPNQETLKPENVEPDADPYEQHLADQRSKPQLILAHGGNEAPTSHHQMAAKRIGRQMWQHLEENPYDSHSFGETGLFYHKVQPKDGMVGQLHGNRTIEPGDVVGIDWNNTGDIHVHAKNKLDLQKGIYRHERHNLDSYRQLKDLD